MPTDEKTLKEQRDRYVAFSFASGDLFIEVAEDGKILDVSGVSKTLTGIDEKSLLGRNWLELFSAYEQAKLQRAKEKTVPGRRMGPVLVALNEQIGQKQAAFSAIRMPKTNRFYIVLGVSNEFLAKIAPVMGLPGTVGFSDRETFSDMARDAVFDAKLWGQQVELTFFDFVTAGDMQERFGKDGWGKIEQSIGEMMAQYSFGGYSAGLITEGRYSFVHDKTVNIDEIKTKILDIAKAAGADFQPTDLKAKSMTGDLKALEKKDISRALDFSIDQFEQNGTSGVVGTLAGGYEAYMDANEMKLKEFKSIIERVNFAQVFQPVINLKTKEATHYEILSRFESGDSQEWIRFGEDAGLAPDFDLAVLDRAINYIKFKAGGNRTKFSIDISGQSMADDEFFEKLKEQLAKTKGLSDRLLFEITECANIEDLDKVANYVKELQKLGFKVALDDFGPSGASIYYLQTLKVDFVKIDGRYIRRLGSSTRDEALVRNLVELCQAAGVEVIAECVEEQAQADMLAGMGIKYAQGHLFAVAGPKPDYVAK